MSAITNFIDRLQATPETLRFEEVIELIEQNYVFEETSFDNGAQKNAAGENSGSCKVLSFAKLNGLTKEQALQLFAQYYQDVLATPEGDDHQNIRQFMIHGYDGLVFSSMALTKKPEAVS